MQVLVIGAGVVGLAIARATALAGHEVIVAEATGGIGNGVSSRNSEVIHAGMYYPTGSLRARHCVRGRRMLYEFCASHGVPHKKVGKLIVAVDEKQTAKIEGIAKQGEINGVEGLEFLGGNAARAMEPALNCVAALLSQRDRHHRQPRLHAGAGRRSGRPRRHDRVQHAGRAPGAHRAGLGGALRRRRGRHACGRCGGELGGARRADDRARHRRLSGGARAAPCARQGQLLRLPGQAGVLAPDLSGAGRRRARHARDARHGGAHALRPGRRVDRARALRRSTPSAPSRSTRACAPIFRGCRTTRWCPTIAASAPS